MDIAGEWLHDDKGAEIASGGVGSDSVRCASGLRVGNG